MVMICTYHDRMIISLKLTHMIYVLIAFIFSTSMLSSSIIEYKQVAGISFTLLVLALVANFGLTIAT